MAGGNNKTKQKQAKVAKKVSVYFIIMISSSSVIKSIN